MNNFPSVYCGRAKYKIIPVAHDDWTQTQSYLESDGRYKLSAAPEIFSALGEGAFYDADGVAKTLDYSTLMATHDGDKIFIGSKLRLLIYSEDQVGFAARMASKWVGAAVSYNDALPYTLPFTLE